jgi:hypothetical protein
MGTAPENQATNVHFTSIVRVIRGEAMRPLSPRARLPVDFDICGWRRSPSRHGPRSAPPHQHLDREIHHRDAYRRRATTCKLKEAMA